MILESKYNVGDLVDSDLFSLKGVKIESVEVYSDGKRSSVIYFINGKRYRESDLKPHRKELTDKEKLGLYSDEFDSFFDDIIAQECVPPEKYAKLRTLWAKFNDRLRDIDSGNESTKS